MMRHIAVALSLTLALAALLATTGVAADGEGPRSAADAVSLSLDMDALTSQSLAQANQLAFEQAVAYIKLEAAKAALRELSRQYRRDRRDIRANVSRALRQCQLDKIEGIYQAERARLQAEIASHRKDLGYVNRQKWLTKAGNRLKQFARFTGEIIAEAGISTRPDLRKLLETAVFGGGKRAIKDALRQGFGLLKKRVVKVFRRRLEEEVTARVTGDRPASPRASAAAACEDLDAGAAGTAPEADSVESYDEGVNSGPFGVSGVYGYSPAFGRQGGAIMSWVGVAGTGCSDFEAYNPEPMDPRNEKLKGISVNLRIDPDRGRFTGVISGKTSSDDFSKGGEATGTFRAIMSGTVTPDLDRGWLIEGRNTSVRLAYKAVRSCTNVLDRANPKTKFKKVDETTTMASAGAGAGPASVSVEGAIRPGVSDWILELDLKGASGGQSLSVSLQDISLGPYWITYPGSAEPEPAPSTSPQPDTSPQPVIPGSDLPAPWD